MMASILPPVILSAIKNTDFHSLITIQSGFFAAIRITGAVAFGINK